MMTDEIDGRPKSENTDPPASCEVSIIIPIGAGDNTWQALLRDLSLLPFSAEVLCVGTAAGAEIQNEPDLSDFSIKSPSGLVPLHWIVSPSGRARQMNLGADLARGRFLWFLHADSRVDGNCLRRLQRSLVTAPDALQYFNLAFLADGPRPMRLNAWGADFRSHVLGLPFGDQGFCLDRASFHRLGKYSETAPYGEDHLLVWMAHRRGIRLRCTGAVLRTSARKYRERGWLRTTCRHVWLTFKQAWPQFWLWLFGR